MQGSKVLTMYGPPTCFLDLISGPSSGYDGFIEYILGIE